MYKSMINNYGTKELKMLKGFGNEYMIFMSPCYVFSEKILVMKLVSEEVGEVLA